MALPQNPDGLTAGDRALLEASNAQTRTLKEQTKVIHKLSDAILEDRKDYRQLRKDIQENQRKFFEGNDKSFSSIKKYFEKQKENSPGFSSKYKMGADKDKDDKGFFKSALSKLFGPSKYQMNLLDQTTALRDISELTRIDINFIKKQYEEPARARERELLAQAIADKINANNDNGGFLSSLLSTLKDAFKIGFGFLEVAFGRFLLSTLPSLLTAAAGAIATALSSLWGKLTTLLTETFDKIKNSFKSPATEPAKPPPVAETARGTPIPSTTNPQLPNGEAPKQLPGPTGAPSDIDERMNTRRQARVGPIEDVVPKGEGVLGGMGGVAGMLSKFLRGLSILGAAILVFEGLFGTSDEELETLRKADAKRKMDSQTNLAAAEAAKTNPMPEFDKGKGDDWEETIAEKISNSFDNIMQMIEDDLGAKFMKANRDYFDQIGEISINGEKVNLLPNLGTAAGKTLDDAMNTGKALYEAAEAVGNGTGNYVASVTNNMIPDGKNGPLAMPMAPAVNTNSTVQQMLYGGVVIGGHRYY
jgi:hypothetical protein